MEAIMHIRAYNDTPRGAGLKDGIDQKGNELPVEQTERLL